MKWTKKKGRKSEGRHNAKSFILWIRTLFWLSTKTLKHSLGFLFFFFFSLNATQWKKKEKEIGWPREISKRALKRYTNDANDAIVRNSIVYSAIEYCPHRILHQNHILLPSDFFFFFFNSSRLFYSRWLKIKEISMQCMRMCVCMLLYIIASLNI